MPTCSRCSRPADPGFATCTTCRAKVARQSQAARNRRREARGGIPATPIVNPAPEASSAPIDDQALLRAENRRLLGEVTRLRNGALTEERVRRELLRLSEVSRNLPEWLDTSGHIVDTFGAPVLFMSDQHLGEVVDSEQIGGVNAYDMEIARARWKRCTEKAVDLAFHCLANPKFPGIVCAFGGDGASGDIHEELSVTNEREIGPVVMELADLIAWSVRELQRAFGKVFVPCVVGNHPRMTHKPRAKGAAFTNFDWLAYQLASREFVNDPNVNFLIPSGSDARFTVYNHRFVLTHGNQFRGGDGIIGPLGPVFRGDNKKRARNAQVGQAYDTLMLGHFHQLRMDPRIIMNGSLKGYDEYAAQNNFPFERPAQALFFVHPRHGITLSFPVLPEPSPAESPSEWLSWPAAAIP